jgi:membrane protein YdbS with pleckstrin-like domain
VGHPGGVPYPDKLLAEDEEVVRHLHPHGLTIFWPVVWFLLIVGGASFGAGLIPSGRQQGMLRLLVLAGAVVLLLVFAATPLLRWRTTHYVITTHRLLFREGILTRRGRDLGLARITDVSYTQTLWERIINSGTLTIESAGEGGATVLRQIPDSDGVQQLLNHMVEEDADRRARASADHLGEYYGPGAPGPSPTDSWWTDPWSADSRPADDWSTSSWSTSSGSASSGSTNSGSTGFRSTRHHEPH